MQMRLRGNFECTCEENLKSEECRRLQDSIRYNGVYMIVYIKSERFIVNLCSAAEDLGFCPLYRNRGLFS